MSIHPGHQRTLRRLLKDDDSLDLRLVRPFQVNYWDALFSTRALTTSLFCYIIFMLSQLILSYIGFLYFDVDNRPIIFVISQLYNMLSSYFFPLVLMTAVDDNIDRPFHDLSEEMYAYQTFLLSVLIESVGFGLTIWATVAIFTSNEKFILIEYDLYTRQNRHVDVASFLRFYQLITCNLMAITLLVSIVNCLITRQKILRYLNRIERMQSPVDYDSFR